MRDKKAASLAAKGDGFSAVLLRQIYTFKQRLKPYRTILHVRLNELTYTVNEFMPPRVKFLPKAAPLDRALLPSAQTRHFLSAPPAGAHLLLGASHRPTSSALNPFLWVGKECGGASVLQHHVPPISKYYSAYSTKAVQIVSLCPKDSMVMYHPCH